MSAVEDKHAKMRDFVMSWDEISDELIWDEYDPNGPEHQTIPKERLEAFCKRFPHFEQRLREFVGHWNVDDPITPEMLEAVCIPPEQIERGMRFMHRTINFYTKLRDVEKQRDHHAERLDAANVKWTALDNELRERDKQLIAANTENERLRADLAGWKLFADELVSFDPNNEDEIKDAATEIARRFHEMKDENERLRKAPEDTLSANPGCAHCMGADTAVKAGEVCPQCGDRLPTRTELMLRAELDAANTLRRQHNQGRYKAEQRAAEVADKLATCRNELAGWKLFADELISFDPNNEEEIKDAATKIAARFHEMKAELATRKDTEAEFYRRGEEIDSLLAEIERLRDLALRALEQTNAETECPECHGYGDVKRTTQQHGPDDYEVDVECQACRGTGATPAAPHSEPQVAESSTRSQPSRADHGPARSEPHQQTDACGFDRDASINEDRYVCCCGYRSVRYPNESPPTQEPTALHGRGPAEIDHSPALGGDLEREVMYLKSSLNMAMFRDYEEQLKIWRERAEAAERDAARYRAAIEWALGGEGSDFRLRQDGEGAYWWRIELRQRAAMKEKP